MTFKKYLEKIRMYSASTSKTYSSYEKLFIKYKGDITKIKIANKSSNSTLRIVLCALKQYRLFIGLKEEKIVLPKKEIKKQDWVSYEKYISYLQKLDNNSKMKKEMRCIVKLLFETGVRASELLSIKWDHISKNRIKIKGKGNRERYIAVSPILLHDLEKIKKETKGNVFNFKYKNLYSRIRRLDKERKVTPHMFRRGYARYCYLNGIPIYDISLTMGHSSISTTTGYIRRGSEDIDISNIFNKILPNQELRSKETI